MLHNWATPAARIPALPHSTYLLQVDPIALSLGPLKIHWYGLMYLLGFAVAWWLGNRRVRAGRLPGVDAHGFGDLMFYAMVGVVLGGRLGYILFYDLHTYIEHPMQMLKVWEGGMSFHGGLLGVVAGVWWWSRKHALHVMDTLEFVAPLVPPGLGFGRIGNFINGELWGKETGADWGVVFPSSLDLQYRTLAPDALRKVYESGALDRFARHPSQLYQAFLEGLVLFTVLWVYSRKPRPRYAVAGLFVLLYGVFRFVVEFVRVPDAQLGYLFGWVTMGQVLSVPLIVLGLAWLWMSRRAPTLQPRAA
ncbi:Prolipoprotein diacylglyceryl transferase [Lysobacter dokdonensis DS-58]|uniref:Phosphatidylglycerol--prolipoprotein diacylglyceryl transferase n=1 Tax=Lysobacter dokdonensis DS-58 TaxID=1300345 RepID=A0A0A2X0Y9_9GAMM|nr:Prolipoprotein diacylglyceryl transferase [Lysobacter dokdonensis DS-58]